MRGQVEMTLPEVALVLGTRAALGIGAGLLLANRLSEGQRRSVGRTLLVAGGFGAAILGAQLFGRPRTRRMTFGAVGGEDRFPPPDLEMLTRETLRVGD